MLKKLSINFYLILQSIFSIFPDFYIGIRLRRILYKYYLNNCGKKLSIASRVHIEVPEKITIGNFTGINMNCWISGGGGIKIGNNVLIGPNVIIHSANHNFSKTDVLIKDQGHSFKEVIIEDDVWIGAGAIILPGVKIKRGSVIGAGSIVTKDIPEYSIAVGNPAKVKKQRDEV